MTLLRSVLLVLMLTLAACQPATSEPNTVAQAPVQTQSWFDTPLNGTQLPLAAVDVISHHYSPTGVAEIELSINGVTLRTDPSPDAKASFVNFSQQWLPAGPGAYTLAVRARSVGGDWGNPATVMVIVGEALTATPSPVPTDTLTPTLAATATATATETATATATATQTATPTATFIPNPTATFTADTLSVSPGRCATLQWTVNGQFNSVFLNGAAVSGNDSAKVCLKVTTAYTLRVVTVYNQNLDQTITIQVTAPSAPFVDFTADSTSLTSGQCTNLHWNSGNIQSIFLNNQPVTGTETRQVCPSATTTYTLTANTDSGPITKQITIGVGGGAPPPSGAPQFFASSFDTDTFYNESGCGPLSVTITQPINNASSATLHYSISGGASGTKPMLSSGTTWKATVANTDLTHDGTGQMTYFVTASNAVGTGTGPVNQQVLYSNCKP